MSTVLIFFTLLLVLLLTIYLYVKNAYAYWQRRGIPYLEPSFPFGNFKRMFLMEKSFPDTLGDLYNSTSEPFFGVYTITSPALVIRDPKIIRDVLIKDFSSWYQRGFNANEDVDLMARNLFLMNGEKWEISRKRFSPAFTTGKLKAMFDTIRDCCLTLDEHVAKYAKSGEIGEFREISARFATNVIASVAFGIDINCIDDPNAVFRQYGKRIFDATVKNMFRNNISILYPNLAQFLRLRFVDKDVGDFMIETVRQNLEYREKNNVTRKDFFQLLMQLRNTGSIGEDNDWSTDATTKEKQMSLEEMAAQVFIFFIAGFESSSTTISFCLYEMSKSPEVQESAYKEISTVLERHEGKLTYDSLSEMSYMEHCIDETLRMHPSFGFLSRRCTKAYKLPDSDIVLEKGTSILIPSSVLQMDPKYYEDPDKFKPERFDENVRANKTFVDTPKPYLPFGDGPRICIAFRLAKLQAKLAIVMLLQKYRFELSELHKNKELKIDPRGYAKMAVGGINLYVRSR